MQSPNQLMDLHMKCKKYGKIDAYVEAQMREDRRRFGHLIATDMLIINKNIEELAQYLMCTTAAAEIAADKIIDSHFGVRILDIDWDDLAKIVCDSRRQAVDFLRDDYASLDVSEA